MMTSAGISNRLHSLDAILGLAAIIVVTWHFPIDHSGTNYLAVDFFFALSGFVVSKAYEDRLRGRMTGLQFIVQHILRLYPLYAIGLAIGVVVAVINMAFNLPDALGKVTAVSGSVLYVLMLPGPIGLEPFPINGPSWSLFLEMAINVAFCLALVRLKTRTLVALVSLSALGLLAAGIARGDLDQGWSWATMPGGVARVSFSFTAGMIIWRLLGQRRQIGSLLWIVPPLALMVVLLIPIPEGFALPYGFVMMFVGMPLLVAAGALLQAPRSAEAGCRFLGDISYPLYITHVPMITLGLLPDAIGIPGGVWMPALVGLLVGLSWLLAVWVDPPVRRYLKPRLF